MNTPDTPAPSRKKIKVYNLQFIRVLMMSGRHGERGGENSLKEGDGIWHWCGNWSLEPAAVRLQVNAGRNWSSERVRTRCRCVRSSHQRSYRPVEENQQEKTRVRDRDNQRRATERQGKPWYWVDLSPGQSPQLPPARICHHLPLKILLCKTINILSSPLYHFFNVSIVSAHIRNLTPVTYFLMNKNNTNIK